MDDQLETGKKTTKADEEFEAPITGDTSSEEPVVETELSEEEIERKCAEVAEKYISDIIDYGRNLPVRFSFSGLSPTVIKNGFHESPFVNDQDYEGYDHALLFHTMNEAFTLSGAEYRGKFLRGIDDSLYLSRYVEHSESDLEDIYGKFPELHDAIETRKQIMSYHQDVRNNLGLTKSYDKITSTGIERMNDAQKEIISSIGTEEQLDEFLYIEQRSDFHVDPQAIINITKEGNDEGFDQEMTLKIIKNLITFKWIGDWSFEEQEYWYNVTVKHQITKFPTATNDRQVYDMAYLIDSDMIKESKQGYLTDEILVSAPPSSIMGIVCTGTEGNIWPGYIIEKMKRTYQKDPSLSRPVYDSRGDLLWPREMDHEEVIEFVEEKDAKKSEEETLDSGSSPE